MFDGPIVYRKLRCFLGMPKKYLMVSRAPGVPKVSYFTVSGVLGVKNVVIYVVWGTWDAQQKSNFLMAETPRGPKSNFLMAETPREPKKQFFNG